MFFGRFLMIIPLMGIAGSLAAKKKLADTAGNVPGRRTALHLPARRRDPHRRRADVLPGALARPVRRALPHERAERCSEAMASTEKTLALRSRRSCAARCIDSIVKLNPRRMMKNPVMFLVEVGALLTTLLLFRDCRTRRLSLPDPDHVLALGHGALRELRRSGGRGTRESAGGRAAEGEDGHDRAARSTGEARGAASRASAASQRRSRRRRSEPDHPRRRHGHRRHRLGQRIRDHRRIGAGHPRSRRRSLRGHRRHDGALRPHRRRDHLGTGPDVHRPDDQARRRRGAAEDAERDRARHPPGRPDDRLPARDGHAQAVRDLLRQRRLASRCSSRCWSA